MELIISESIQLFILIAIAVQCFMIHKTYKADHERRRKQSTIEYVNQIRKIYHPIKIKLDTAYGEDKPINPSQISAEEKDQILTF